MPRWSTGCWPRRNTASAGPGTGSTWPATPTPRATSFTEDGRYPYAYTYRDYVVRAFNEDLPYNRFMLEQLAADQLPLGDDNRGLGGDGLSDASAAASATTSTTSSTIASTW